MKFSRNNERIGYKSRDKERRSEDSRINYGQGNYNRYGERTYSSKGNYNQNRQEQYGNKSENFRPNISRGFIPEFRSGSLERGQTKGAVGHRYEQNLNRSGNELSGSYPMKNSNTSGNTRRMPNPLQPEVIQRQYLSELAKTSSGN